MRASVTLMSVNESFSPEVAVLFTPMSNALCSKTAGSAV